MKLKRPMVFVTFLSEFDATMAEKTVSPAFDEARLVPVPRSISSSCGSSLMIYAENAEKVKALMQEKSLIYDDFYRIDPQ